MILPRDYLARSLACIALLVCGAACAADLPETLLTGLRFAEGTIFVDDRLYLVDYTASDVYRVEGMRLERIWHQDGCGANGLVRVPEGLMVACFDGNAVQTITLDGKPLGRFSHDDRNITLVSPNDFAADARGGLYITASGSGGETGRVFYRRANGAVREVASHLAFANGVGVSPDGRTLYVTESTAGRIDAMPIAADGSLGPARVFARLSEAIPGAATRKVTPDSLRVDGAGNVFAALYDGGGVAVFDAAGKLLRHIEVPGAHHTTLALTPDGRSIVVTAVDDAPDGSRSRLLKLPLVLR
jgi:gluconolactonase